MVKGHSDQYIFGKTEQRLKNIQPNSALIMQQQLDMPLKDPQLVIRTNHQWVSVYIGEKLIYSYAPTKQQKDPGLLQSAIHLPSNYRKEKLRIVTKHPMIIMLAFLLKYLSVKQQKLIATLFCTLCHNFCSGSPVLRLLF